MTQLINRIYYKAGYLYYAFASNSFNKRLMIIKYGKKICRKIIRKYIHIYILACLRPPIGCKYEVEIDALHHMLRHMLALKPFCLLWQLVMAPSFKITPANLKGKSSFAPQSKPHLVLTYKKKEYLCQNIMVPVKYRRPNVSKGKKEKLKYRFSKL